LVSDILVAKSGSGVDQFWTERMNSPCQNRRQLAIRFMPGSEITSWVAGTVATGDNRIPRLEPAGSGAIPGSLMKITRLGRS